MDTTVEPNPSPNRALSVSPQWGPTAAGRPALPLALPRLERPLLPVRPALIAVATVLTLATIALASSYQHAHDFLPGTAAQAVRSAVPVAAGLVAAYSIFRPWRAILLVLLLTPCWNAAQVSWQVGPVQVILQTIFTCALAVGTWRWRRSHRQTPAFEESAGDSGTVLLRVTPLTAIRRWAGRFEAHRFAEVATLGLVGLAVLSTLQSANVVLSATVLLHGIVEPVALAAVVVLLRPSRRDLILLATILGASAAIGGLLNILQSMPGITSFAAMQARRLTFARVGYFNVGLFGVVLAAVIPLIVGIVGRGRLARAQPRKFALMLVILSGCLIGLFLTFSKSAYMASTAGTVLVLVLLAGTWRRRAAIVLTAGLLSTILIPWPAFALQAFPGAASAYRSADIALVGESRFDSWNPATRAGHGSLSERFYAVEGGLAMSQSHPLLGVGLDQFRTYYTFGGYKPSEATTQVDHAHSVFPEIAAELGQPAMILVIVLFAAALWAMRRVYRNASDPGTRALAASLAAAMVAWLIAATAFGVDIYRPDRALSTDVVVAAIIVAAALALARTMPRTLAATRAG